MRCLIGFFGITRSLRHTAASIEAAFYQPLRRAGIPMLRAGHFNIPVHIDNPRSGETAIPPDRNECKLLDLDLCWNEPQSDEAVALELRIGRTYPDLYGDGFRSLSNLCHQLHSLQRLWAMIELLNPVDTDLVLLLRPDLFYLDAIDPAPTLSPLLSGAADLIVPAWQSWGGLNDRFAFCTVAAAREYATRKQAFIAACAELGGMHPESFLAVVARHHGWRVATTDMRGVRVRANGSVARNDAAMLAKGSTMAA